MPLNAAFKRPSDADAVVVVVVMMMMMIIMAFFLQQDQNSDQFNYINFKQFFLNITDTQALSDQISIPFILILVKPFGVYGWIYVDFV